MNQEIAFDYKPQFIKREIQEKELKRSRTYPNDVLMNIVGPPLGKVALVPNDFPEWNINQAIVTFRTNNFFLSKWLYFILCEGSQVRAIDNETRGVAGQTNISLSQCRNFVFPVPPLAEQTEIVKRVEALFDWLDAVEAAYTEGVSQLKVLPQSLLHKAFSGQLVPQDPTDEPASVLLERIQAEKKRQAEAAKAEKTAVRKFPKKKEKVGNVEG